MMVIKIKKYNKRKKKKKSSKLLQKKFIGNVWTEK